MVRAELVPCAIVVAHWSWRQLVNGHVLFMRPELLDHADSAEITDLLRQAARGVVRGNTVAASGLRMGS